MKTQKVVAWKYVCCHRHATVNPAPSPGQRWRYWSPHPEKWWDKHFCLSHRSWMMREYVTVINKYEFPGKCTASKSLTLWSRQQSNIRKSPKTINICEVWSWTLTISMWQGYSWPLLRFASRVIFTEGYVLHYFSKLSKYSFSTLPLHWYHLKVCSCLFCLLTPCSTVCLGLV